MRQRGASNLPTCRLLGPSKTCIESDIKRKAIGIRQLGQRVLALPPSLQGYLAHKKLPLP